MLRKLACFCLFVVVAFAPVSVSAQAGHLTSETARDFINGLGKRTLSALQQQNAQQRIAEIGRILLDGMDFDIVSMHTLGRYGRRPDSDEFREFSRLFSAYIIDLAVEKFGSTAIESYAVNGAQELPNGDVLVQTNVVQGAGGSIGAGWRVRETPAGPKIIDILVDGYSMTTHFNGLYADWLSKAGLSGLVNKMRGQTRNSPSLALVQSVRGS